MNVCMCIYVCICDATARSQTVFVQYMRNSDTPSVSYVLYNGNGSLETCSACSCRAHSNLGPELNEGEHTKSGHS